MECLTLLDFNIKICIIMKNLSISLIDLARLLYKKSSKFKEGFSL